MKPSTPEECPFPIDNDDGTAAMCRANGHCGCEVKQPAPDPLMAEAEGLGGINALAPTDEEKAEAFEWLRRLALDNSLRPFAQRMAAIALSEWHATKATASATRSTITLPRDVLEQWATWTERRNRSISLIEDTMLKEMKEALK